MGYDYSYSGSIKITPEVSMRKAKEVNQYQGERGGGRGTPEGWCLLEINEDGELAPSGGEGHCDVAAWIDFFLEGPLEGYKLNGSIMETCGDFMSQEEVLVEDSVIYKVEYEFKAGPKVPYEG